MPLVGGGGSLLLGTIPAILYMEPFGRRFLGLRHATGLLHPPVHHRVFLAHGPCDQRPRSRGGATSPASLSTKASSAPTPASPGSSPPATSPTYAIGNPRTSPSASSSFLVFFLLLGHSPTFFFLSPTCNKPLISRSHRPHPRPRISTAAIAVVGGLVLPAALAFYGPRRKNQTLEELDVLFSQPRSSKT